MSDSARTRGQRADHERCAADRGCAAVAGRTCAGRGAAAADGCPRLPSERCCAAGQRRGWRASRPVGRVLCTRGCGPTAIHLGLPLPAASCGLPASIGRAVLKRSRRKRKHAPLPSWPCSGWGLPSRPGHPGRWWSLTPPFHPYLRGRPRAGHGGGLFSVALSRGSPRVGVTDHPALRSPDLPHRASRGAAARPTRSPPPGYCPAFPRWRQTLTMIGGTSAPGRPRARPRRPGWPSTGRSGRPEQRFRPVGRVSCRRGPRAVLPGPGAAAKR